MVNFPMMNDKYRYFIRYPSKVDFMEGTTFGGKTTVAIVKFLMKVAMSRQKLHVLAGLDTGVIEKNIVNKDLGILDVWGDYIEYRPKGNKEHSSPHLRFDTDNGEKIIYLLGYDNKRRWQKVLGGQYGCVFIDEINTADIDFVQEVWIRFDYLIATLNPDNPDLEIYEGYINRSRPTEEYVNDTPSSILEELTEPEEEGWVHWFFSFDDNPALTDERRESLLTGVPRGTKQYKNKILGERGRAEGLVFPNFGSHNLLEHDDILGREYALLNIGIDTSYSTRTDDTIVYSLTGITEDGDLVIVNEEVYTNKDKENPYTVSDVSRMFWETLDFWERTVRAVDYVYIDSADQATRNQLIKDARLKGKKLEIINSKKLPIKERVEYMNGWIGREGEVKPKYYVSRVCDTHIREMSNYSYDGEAPEDKNDHTINASQYSWEYFVNRIGVSNRRR